MLTILGLTLVFLIACFGFVLLFGAPYLPTLGKQAQIAMDFADLKPGQTLLELGCGDGKILMAAAERGWRAVGYELNPLLVIFCRFRTWRYRKLVTVKWGNFWSQDWPITDAIFVFVMQRHMKKLDTKIMQYLGVSGKKPLKLVSFAFTIPGKKPIKTKDGVYLYLYK